MSNTENTRIPSQRREQWPADVVEYGPEVPLAERLEHERELMHAD
jgi:hypothetical protein